MSKILLWLSGAWRSRTMWAATGITVVGIVYDQLGLLRSLINPSTFGAIMIAAGVTMGVLRILTVEGLLAKVPGTTSAPK